MTFAEKFKELRKEKNITQEDMAKLFNFNRSTIANYETSRNYPDTDTLQKLADYFDCSVDYLLGRTDIKKSQEIYSKDGVNIKVLEEKNLTVDGKDLVHIWYDINGEKVGAFQELEKYTRDLPQEGIKDLIKYAELLKLKYKSIGENKKEDDNK